MLPNFLIGGGVAAGTSFLSATLAHHPDIYLPRVQRPEPNFFHYSSKFEQGLEWYQESWFHETAGERAIGERSSLLLTSKPAPERIASSLPGIRIIFCLRNPVERAWANYRFSVLEGLEALPFEEAIRQEEDRMQRTKGRWAEVQPNAYVTRSRYAEGLRRYIDLFGADRILVLQSEDLGRNPKDNILRVCDFLGVERRSDLPLPPNYSSPSVVDPAIQVELRRYFGDRFSELVESIRKEEETSFTNMSEYDADNIERLRQNLRGQKDSMSQDSRQLLRDKLAEDIAALRDMVGFSVEDWT